MFLVSEERLSHYAPPIRILMLGIALAVACLIFYYSIWDLFYKIIFTDEPRVSADYAGFCVAIACLFVIISTAIRLIRHIADEVQRKLD